MTAGSSALIRVWLRERRDAGGLWCWSTSGHTSFRTDALCSELWRVACCKGVNASGGPVGAVHPTVCLPWAAEILLMVYVGRRGSGRDTVVLGVRILRDSRIWPVLCGRWVAVGDRFAGYPSCLFLFGWRGGCVVLFGVGVGGGGVVLFTVLLFGSSGLWNNGHKEIATFRRSWWKSYFEFCRSAHFKSWKTLPKIPSTHVFCYLYRSVSSSGISRNDI